jgi:hypothetical protein
MIRRSAAALLLMAGAAVPQSAPRYRMEIRLERVEANAWHAIDPGLVLEQGDRVRFRIRTNFDGYLYVTNLASSGSYQQLFPTADTGSENRISGGKEYQVPETSTVFRVAGPAGYETVYWLVTPAPIAQNSTKPDAAKPVTNITPRCDDSIWRSRGDCVDSSAGPKLVPRGADLPTPLAQAEGQSRRDLMFLRQDNKTVISGAGPLTAPVIYEFRLAHR